MARSLSGGFHLWQRGNFFADTHRACAVRYCPEAKLRDSGVRIGDSGQAFLIALAFHFASAVLHRAGWKRDGKYLRSAYSVGEWRPPGLRLLLPNAPARFAV